MIPINAAQKRIAGLKRQLHQSDGYSQSHCYGEIVTVWDVDAQADGVPDNLKGMLTNHPNKLYATIKTSRSVSKLTLPFSESPDQIISTYGNGAHLVGRACKISYNSNNLETGTLSICEESLEPLASLQETSSVSDISMVL